MSGVNERECESCVVCLGYPYFKKTTLMCTVGTKKCNNILSRFQNMYTIQLIRSSCLGDDSSGNILPGNSRQTVALDYTLAVLV